jgi:hypothetical protein
MRKVIFKPIFSLDFRMVDGSQGIGLRCRNGQPGAISDPHATVEGGMWNGQFVIRTERNASQNTRSRGTVMHEGHALTH